jgi:hypothetical protein
MSFTIEEIWMFLGFAGAIALVVGGYMIVSRKKRWM